MIKSVGVEKDIREKYEETLRREKEDMSYLTKLLNDVLLAMECEKHRVTCPICGEIIEYTLLDDGNKHCISCPNCSHKIDTWEN